MGYIPIFSITGLRYSLRMGHEPLRSKMVTRLEKQNGSKDKSLEHKVTTLEEKLTVKNEVLSELMEEHIALKKRLGGL